GPRAAGAGNRLARGGRAHARRLRGGRHRRRAGRQLRAHPGRRGDRAPRGEGGGARQPPRRARLQRERDVRAQSLQFPQAGPREGRARHRLERRGIRAVVSDTLRRDQARSDGRGSRGCEMTGMVALYIFMLAAFTGYEVISRVPVILHTPLMSGSNFVHGIVLVGAMVALGSAATPLEKTIGFIGVLLGAGNAVGGYVVTERMLEMFKSSGRAARQRPH